MKTNHTSNGGSRTQPAYEFPDSNKEQEHPKESSSSSSSASSLQEMSKNIRDAFDTNGFVVLRDYSWDDKDEECNKKSTNAATTTTTATTTISNNNAPTPSITAKILLNDWYSLAQDVFASIFRDLYEGGHTDFPRHCRYNGSDNGGVVEKGDNNNNEQQQQPEQREYAMRGLGVKHGFKQVVMRSPGRYEISLMHPLLKAQQSQAHHDGRQEAKIDLLRDYMMRDCPLLTRIVPLLLHVSPPQEDDQQQQQVEQDERGYYLSNMSLVVSTPGSPAQSWHADGGHLHLEQHLPCHCLNIFVPLHNITQTLGPTQLRPQTHVYTRNLAPLLLAAHCKKQLQPSVAPLLKRGDVLVFDYRILHRGLANREEKDKEVEPDKKDKVDNEQQQQQQQSSSSSSSSPASSSSRPRRDDSSINVGPPQQQSSTRTTSEESTTTSRCRDDNDNNNNKDKNRYILVFTIAKKGFKDVLNFPSRSIYDDDDDKYSTN